MNKESIPDSLSRRAPNRLLDAALLCFDLPRAVENMKQEESWKMGERNSVRLLKSAFMRIVLIALPDHAEINFNQSGNVISIQLLEGKLNFKTEEQSVMMDIGSLITIHEETAHTIVAQEKSVFLLTISLCPKEK